ncbi:MAG: 3-oxoacyl-ACP synthase III [Desulfobacteraceae bacterium]|nr:3-oxoacyl-ACP synthase III [Desulfobacteraceae bacterium]
MRYSKVYIKSFGYELPPNVIASDDIEDRLDPVYNALRIQKGQLEAITGIHERRFWNPGYKMYEGAVAAGKKAIQASGISPESIGILIYAGVCRDNLEPATACAVSDGLKLGSKTEIYDVSNACLGVINGMIQVANAIELGHIKAGIVVSCESARNIVDITIDNLLKNPDMELFKETIATLTGGSGAVAVILTDESLSNGCRRLAGGVVRSAPEHHKLCLWGPDAGEPVDGFHVMKTDSVGVLQNGVPLGLETFRDFMREMAWPDNKPDKTICHQVGASHQKSILESINIPKEKDFTTFRYLGNIGTVSLPITAAIASEREFLVENDLVGFFGIGSGLNCMMLGVEW